MAKRHRHHRRISVSSMAVTSQMSQTLGTRIEPLDSSLSLIRQDLLKTLVMVIIFIASLVILQSVNQHFPWTPIFGDQIYRILHIR